VFKVVPIEVVAPRPFPLVSRSVVFKVVPIEGAALVNGYPQKKAAEMTGEALVALTLSGLRDERDARGGGVRDNVAPVFVETTQVRGGASASKAVWPAQRGTCPPQRPLIGLEDTGHLLLLLLLLLWAYPHRPPPEDVIIPVNHLSPI